VDRVIHDLEIWLIGTPDEVKAAMAALATLGRIAAASRLQPLYGSDAGRFRRYARITVTTTRQQRGREVA
jgi:hypothetical protein